MASRPGAPGKSLPALAGSPGLFADCMKALGSGSLVLFSHQQLKSPCSFSHRSADGFIVSMLFVKHVELRQ